MTEKKKEKEHCACWARTAAAQQAQPERRPSALVHARARFKPEGWGPGINERERGDREERLTGGARLSSLTL